MSGRQSIAMIAAVGRNLELGSKGELIWHISADLKNFKALTTGHPVIMGRKTWESLPKRPLPGRLNIIMTRSGLKADGAVTAGTPEEAIEACAGRDTLFVIGGQQIYDAFLPLADTLYITAVDAVTDKEIDTWFPEYHQDWSLAEASDWEEDAKGVRYRFEKWLRK